MLTVSPKYSLGVRFGVVPVFYGVWDIWFRLVKALCLQSSRSYRIWTAAHSFQKLRFKSHNTITVVKTGVHLLHQTLVRDMTDVFCMYPVNCLNKHSTAGDLGYCMFFSSSTTFRPTQYFCFGGCNSLTQGNNFTQIQLILSLVDRTPRLTANLGLCHQSKQEFPKLKGCKTNTELLFLLPDLQVTRGILPCPGMLSLLDIWLY